MIKKGQAKIIIDYKDGLVHVFHGETNNLLCCYQESRDTDTFKLIWNLLESYCDKFEGFRLGKPYEKPEEKKPISNVIDLDDKRLWYANNNNNGNTTNNNIYNFW